VKNNGGSSGNLIMAEKSIAWRSGWRGIMA